jgi:hypothetical protein
METPMPAFFKPVVLAGLVMMASSLVSIEIDGLCARVLTQGPARPQGWDSLTHGDRAAPDYARLFALDRVHELSIQVSAEDFRRMQDDLVSVVPMLQFARDAGRGVMPPPGGGPPGGGVLGRGWNLTTRDPAYVPVTVRHDGRAWTRVGMRYKGNFSLMMSAMMSTRKISFRLNFDHYEDAHPDVANQRFYGFNELTFSSNFGDESQLREALANEVFRDRGVPAPRVAFYRILVDSGNGAEYWGLYTMVEDPADGAMLRTQFGGSSGNLYKPDGPGADWTKFDRAGFEKKTNKTRADFSDVESAIGALHTSGPPAEWRANLEKRLDVDHFLRWLAVNQVVDNWDSYGRFAHNYYVYGDPGRGGRLAWIPWDNNFAFGGAPFGLGARSSASPGPVSGFMFGSSDDVLWERVGREWPLISRLLADPTYRARYRVHLANALGGLYEPESLSARVRAWHALIAPSVLMESPSRTMSSPEQFQTSIDGPAGLLGAVDRRRALVKAALGR